MTQNNKKIAVTGGMGSGKSCVLEIIKGQGYPVNSCDEIYSNLLLSPQFLQELKARFGNVLNGDGTLNRAALSSIVFSDSKKLKKLNQITHPKIMAEALRWAEGYPLSFIEVPLLFENGFEKLFNGVIVVLRDENQRLEAVVNRDGITKEQAQKRIKSQFNYQNSDFAKYYVIHNNSNLDDLRLKTIEILQKIVLQ